MRAALLLILLGACAHVPGPSPIAPGVDRRADAVDGLVVGHRLMAAGEFELARKAYLRAAAEGGFSAEVLTGLGLSALRLGFLGQAEDRFREAVDRDPSFVPALNNLGVVLMEIGEFAEARLHFRAAFAADSGQSDDIRANLARALSKLDAAAYTEPDQESFSLERRGNGSYVLMSAG